MPQTNLRAQSNEGGNMVALEDGLAKMRTIQANQNIEAAELLMAFGNTGARNDALANLKTAIVEFQEVAEICDVIINMEWALGRLKDKQLVERTKK